ncbi:MAG: PAS domain S-box protein [Methanomassiliicoccaceae archaeon]|jgi:PAS domain S-box-containing protein
MSGCEEGFRKDCKGGKAEIDMTDDAVLLGNAVVRSMNTAIVATALDGTVSLWNRGAQLTLGYPEKEMMGRPIQSLFDPGYGAKVAEVLEKIQQAGSAPTLVANMRTRHGETARVSVTASPLLDGHGNTTGVSFIIRDLSSAIEERILSERYRRFIDIVNQLPYYLVLLTPDYRIVFANRAFIEQFGAPGNKRCYEHLFGSSRPCENCESFQVLKTNEPHVWDWPAPNGRFYAVYDFPFIDEDGTSLIMESGIDITEQKLADEALRKAGAYNRSLIEASLDPMVTIGPDGKITDANTATAKVTGVSQKDLIGTDFSDYFTDPEKARIGYETVFREGLVRDYELEIRRTDGHITPVLYNASVYRDDSGNIIGVFAAARDITARKLFENELKEQREREMERLLELEKFQRLTVGRELKMVELKKEIAALKKEIEALQGKRR